MIHFVFQKSLSFVVSGLMCFSVGWGFAEAVGLISIKETPQAEMGIRAQNVPVYEPSPYFENSAFESIEGTYAPVIDGDMDFETYIGFFYEDESGGPLASVGTVSLEPVPDDFEVFVDKHPKYYGSTVFFETEQKKGIWFTFEGELDARMNENGTVDWFIRGRLTKYRFGHKVESTDADFVYFVGC